MSDTGRATYKIAVTEQLFGQIVEAISRLSLHERRLVSFHSAVITGCKHLEQEPPLQEAIFGDCASLSEPHFAELALIIKAEDKRIFFAARDYLQALFKRRISSCEIIAAAIGVILLDDPRTW